MGSFGARDLEPRAGGIGWAATEGSFDEPAVSPSCPTGPIPPPARCRPCSTGAVRTTATGELVGSRGHRAGLARAPARVGRQRVRPVAAGRRRPPGWVRSRRYRSRSAGPGNSTIWERPRRGRPCRGIRRRTPRARYGWAPRPLTTPRWRHRWRATSTQPRTTTCPPWCPAPGSARRPTGFPRSARRPYGRSSDPLSPAAIPGARRRTRRPSVTKGPGGGARPERPVVHRHRRRVRGRGRRLFRARHCGHPGAVGSGRRPGRGRGYAALRRSGSHPATLLGLVATGAAMVAAYAKGVAALPLVLVLRDHHVDGLVPGRSRAGVDRWRASPPPCSASSGSAFSARSPRLLLAPSQYPQRHGIAFLLGAVVATVGADVGALAIGAGWDDIPWPRR